MELRAEQLPDHLGQTLAPIYLLTGDEPLPQLEAADAIRAAARARDYDERQVLHVDSGFDWGRLTEAANSPSLFANRRILELRMPKPQPGKDGGQALAEFAQRPPEDTVLLITTGKMDNQGLKTKWAKSLIGVGVLMRFWPMERARLPQWIEARMRAKGMNPAPAAVRLLAERVEGNLLAANQEVDKLALLFGPGDLGEEQILAAVADSARFDVFALADAALEGDGRRTLHILEGLKAEGVAGPVVLWALADNLRILAACAERPANAQQVFRERRVFERRKPLLQRALRNARPAVWTRLLRRCAKADRIIKGREAGREWDALLDISLGLARAAGR